MTSARLVIAAVFIAALSACGGGGGGGGTTSTGGNNPGGGSGGQTSYTVTPSISGSGGSISPLTAVTVQSGGTASFTLTPNSGYIAAVSGSCPGTFTGSNVYTTKAITANCTVVASFTATSQTYTVTPSVSGGGGTIGPSTAVSVKSGATTAFTLNPGSGYSVASVGGTCNGSLNGNTYTTKAITGNCTVVASFVTTAQSYTVTPSVSGGGGTISPSTSVVVNSGKTTAFTLTPASGYAVGPVSGSCGGTLSGATYTTNAITGNCTVVATFTATVQSFTVTPSVSGGNGTISPSTAVTVNSGATTSFTLNPGSGYSVVSVGGTCNGSLSGTTYTTNAITGNCTVVATFASNSNGTLAASSLARNTSPNVPATDAASLQQSNTAFATDLYATLRNESAFANQNLFFSPFSISEALTMTYAGAKGTTASQLKNTLHFTLPDASLYPAFDALDLALTAPRTVGQGQVQPTLNIANSMWGEATMTFQQPFLDILATDFGSGIYRVDFMNQPDAARITINDWVAGKTNDKIPNLIPAGGITYATRLVLANAVYFNAGWSAAFSPSATTAGTFHGVNGDATAQMMSQTSYFAYGTGSGWRAITLPYDGGLTFTAILPDNLATFESSFNATTLASIDSALQSTYVTLTMPKFKIPGVTFSVKDALTTLGTTLLFDPIADLTGIAILPPLSNEHLYVSDVLHQAYISVDEKGTEAAAATAVVIGITTTGTFIFDPPPPVILTLDKPFIFLIRDSATGAILFLGRYVGG